MRLFENAAKHPIITISILVGLNLAAMGILVFVLPVGRMLNGEPVVEDSSGDFLPERYDHSVNAESTQSELNQKLEENKSKQLDKEFVHLYDKLGDAYLAESNYQKAIKTYSSSVELRSKLGLPDDDEKARTLIGLAAAHEFLYQYAQAEDAARKALLIREKIFGRKSPYTFVALVRLAEVYHWAGKTKECEETYENAIDVAEELREWSQVLMAQHRLAEHLEEVDELEKAAVLARESLDLAEREYGYDENALIKAYTFLAEIKYRQEHNKEAEENFLKAISKVNKVEPDNAIDAIDAYTIFLWETDREEEAKKKLKEYCNAIEEQYKNDGTVLCSAMENLHTRLYGYTQTQLGIFTAEKNLELSKKYFGNRSEQAIRAYGALASACARLDPKKSKETIEIAIEFAHEKLPERAWARQDLHERYADGLSQQKNYDAAQREYQLSYKEVEPNDHATASRLLAARAAILETQEKHTEARDEYKTAIAESEKDPGNDNANLFFNLALIEMDAFRNYTEAADLLLKSIRKSEQNFGQGYSLEAVRPLIECYEKLGDKKGIDEAKKKLINTYLKALAMDERKYGEKNVRVVNDLEYCGDAYFTAGYFRLAEQYYARSKELNLKVSLLSKDVEQHENNCKLLIAMCQANLGKEAEAADNFKEAFEFFDKHKDESLDAEEDVALKTYATVLKKLKRNSEASMIEKKIAASNSD